MLKIVFYVLWCSTFSVAFGNYTFTHEMEIRCKEHICRHGYSYDTFYEVDENWHKTDPEHVLEMHIAILAASNGHILLSTKPNPNKNDPVYEIVVGGGNNRFTELRRNLKRNAKNSAKTSGILSAIEFRPFYLIIHSDGTITFGPEGSEIPTLEYFDTDPLPIKFFSFASWQGVEAKFLYDCPLAGNDTEVQTDSKEIEKKLPTSELLKKTLLEDKSPYTPPEEIVDVTIGINLITATYDAFESILKTTFFIIVIWNDKSLSWDLNKFNGTEIISLRPGQIWIPDFMAYNSADDGGLTPSISEPITVHHNGQAFYTMKTTASTWCVDYKGMRSFNGWPRDKYTCNLIIGPWVSFNNYNIQIMDKLYTTKMIKPVKNSWDISGTQSVVSHSSWKKLISLEDNSTTSRSDKLIITLNLTRNADAYTVILYTPLIVLSIFVLMSFWTEPLQMTRIWFHAGFSIIVCLGLSFVDILVPCHTLPSILVLYTCVLAGNLLALILLILMLHPIMEPLYKSRIIQAVLMCKIVRFMFCLQTLKTCNLYETVNEGYCDDTEELEPSQKCSNVEQMEVEPSYKIGSREEFAIILDKTMFVIYSVVLAVLFASHY